MPIREDGTLDRQAALDWIAANVASHERHLPPGAALEGPTVAPVEAVEAPEARRGPGRPPAPGSTTYGDARRLLEVLKAQRMKLEVDRLRGRLLEREAVVAEAYELGRQYRDAWLNWPARIAAILAARWGIDPLTVQHDLDVEVRAQLGGLAGFTLEGRGP